MLKLKSIMHLNISFYGLFIIFHVLDTQNENISFDEILMSLIIIWSSNSFFIWINFDRWGLHISWLEYLLFNTLQFSLRQTLIKESSDMILQCISSFVCTSNHLSLWISSFASPRYYFTLYLCKSRLSALSLSYPTFGMENLAFSFICVIMILW